MKSDDPVALDPETRTDPPLDYGRAKLEAEGALTDLAAEAKIAP